jgi:glycosyltransferase involved in cell wall biosynthesis
MKIAFVYTNEISDFHNHKDSISIWNYNVAKKLSTKANIIIYAPRFKNQKKVETYSNIVLYRLNCFIDPIIHFILPILYKHIFFLKNKNDKPYFSSILYHFFYGFHLSLNIRKNKPDIIHISEQTQFIPIIKALNPYSKIILHMHCNALNQLNYNMIKKRIYKVDLIIAPSKYIINKIKTKFNNKVKVIYNGVNSEIFKPITYNENIINKNKINLLFVGRISPEKGVHILIKSFYQVLKQNSNLQLHIIGKRKPLPKVYLMSLLDETSSSLIFPYINGEKWYISYLDELITNLGINNQVIFHGSMDHEKIIGHYNNADILLNPSLSESFGMSLIEAGSCEKPVIASDAGGMPEIVINGETGLIVGANSVTDLSRAILKLISNNDLSKKMGKNGRKRVIKYFNWENIVEDLFTEYKKVKNNPIKLEKLLDSSLTHETRTRMYA